MKYIIFVMIVLAVFYGGITLYPQKEVYQAPEVVEVEKEVDALEQSIKSAQAAKKADIEAVANMAWQNAYDLEMTKVELEVIQSFNAKLDARQTELEKETRVY